MMKFVFWIFTATTLLLASLCLVNTASSTTNNYVKGKYFDRIMIMMFENQNFVDTLKYEYFKSLNNNGTLLTQYFAVTHPSQPNYVAQLGGSFFGQATDHHISLDYSNLVDLLEPKNITWKSYQENFPHHKPCFDGDNYKKLYYRKHNPFIIYSNIRNNPKRCANIVNADHLEADLKSNQLPQLMYYTPNINNDGHNTGLEYANNYLRNFLPHYLNTPAFMENTLVLITFDEDDYKQDNRVYTMLLGSMVKPGVQDPTQYNHYSLLRTIEDNWNLGTLGREDDHATPFQCFV